MNVCLIVFHTATTDLHKTLASPALRTGGGMINFHPLTNTYNIMHKAVVLHKV